MVRWPRIARAVDGADVVAGLGALYVALALGRAAAVATADGSAAAALLNFAQVGGPGLALVYGGRRLREDGIRPDAYPRVVAWCLGTAGALLGVVGLLVLDPGVTINHPVWSSVIAAAVGNLGGLAIGANEARAISRASEAEEHERRLQRQNDRLESFASMLAHELRNPLNVAQLYLPAAAEGDEAAAEEVAAAHDRIEEMIEVLLVTARNGDADVDREAVSLASVARAAWADVPDGAASLVVETDLTVRGDRVHLHHLLENRFRNSVENADGDATVRVGALADETVGADAPPDDARDGTAGFYVADDGPGIPADERASVFEAGYTTTETGIGLGLTFVARLADAYDWDYRITESESGGARFEFTDVGVAESRKKRRD